MSDDRRSSLYRVPVPLVEDGLACELDAEGHCVTCSDEALPVQVLSVDEVAGLACVTVHRGYALGEPSATPVATEEVDISLVESVVPGDMLLVHGGVAIGKLEEASGEA